MEMIEIYNAIINNNINYLLKYIDDGNDFNFIHSSCTPLEFSFKNNKTSIEILNLIIKNTSLEFINLIDKNNETLLNFLSNDDKNIDKIKLLLKYNANININNKWGMNSFHKAIFNHSENIINEYLNYDNNLINSIDNINNRNCIHWFILKNEENLKLFKFLLNKIDKNILFTLDLHKKNILFYAIEKNFIEYVKILINEYKELLNFNDLENSSPFIYAINTNNLELINFILDNSTEKIINTIDIYNRNCLHWIAHIYSLSYNMDFIKKLFLIKINYNLIDKFGQKAIDIAKELKNYNLVNFLSLKKQ